ncbi:MAG TPA: ABC transporter substrate-binding protein [Labilithrix sp.]
MRSIRRRIELAACALALAGCDAKLPAPILASSGEHAEPKHGGTLTLATYGDLRSLDPANVGDGLAPDLLENMFAGLVDYDFDGKIIPVLAEKWSVEDGGKAYRFTLHQGVRMQDGEELTADDVRRSVERALHPTTPNAYASYYETLLGYDAYRNKKTEHLAGVEATGRYEVLFRLKDSDATFLPVLAMFVLRPTCKSAGERFVDQWRPCGAGAFKLAEWDHGRSVTLVRHDGYFRPGLPRLDGMKYLFHVNQLPQTFKFVNGELDIIREFLSPDILRFQSDPRWRPFGVYEPEKQIVGEAMNVEMKPFDNVEIRRAIAAAVDREALAMVRASNLRAANQFVPRDVFGYDPNLRGQQYDYQAALEHMKKAGYPYDPATKTGGYPDPIPYYVPKQGLQEYMGQVLKQQLEKIGIRIEMRLVNYPAFIAIRGRRNQAPFGSGFWQQDYPDAGSFLEPLFHSKSINDEDSNNWSFYKNPRVDALLDDARRELDPPKRMKLYTEAQTILCDDAPWAIDVFYHWYSQTQGYVRDWRPHPMYLHQVSETWIDRPPKHDARAALFPQDPRDLAAALLGRRR